MSGRAVVVGATGFTGRLTARALAARGVDSLLVGRDRTKLAALGEETRFRSATVGDAADVESLIDTGDVVVSLVGPFLDHGYGPLRAALTKSAHYIDCAGEPAFLLDVFSNYSAAAAAAGVTVIPAMAADWVPGNIAGALALAEAPAGSVSALEIAYVMSGPTFALSAGSTRTGARLRAAARVGFAWRGGRIVDVAGAESVTLDFNGQSRVGYSVSGTEHLALPALSPELEDIRMYLSFPEIASADGPDDDPDGPGVRTRRLNRQWIEAKARTASGEVVSRCVLDGPNGYDYSGAMLAWSAERLLAGDALVAGAVGPVSGFGLTTLLAGSAHAGMARLI
jgi:uncharacterized protein YbjT (DUF2867 family)